MYLIFNDNSQTKYYIRGFSEEGNVIIIQIKDDIPENNSGFKIFSLYEETETPLKDCTSYVTKYNVSDIGKAIMFSNDGSIETEDNKLDVYYKDISYEELRESSLGFLKSTKIDESKKLLSQFLKENPLKSSCHNNTEAIYSVTLEKQSLMTNRYITYQIEKQLNSDAVLEWNESGKESEVWMEEEFLQLILEVKQYVYPAVSYQQSIETSIIGCKSVAELDLIEIDYTQFITQE